MKDRELENIFTFMDTIKNFYNALSKPAQRCFLIIFFRWIEEKVDEKEKIEIKEEKNEVSI